MTNEDQPGKLTTARICIALSTIPIIFCGILTSILGYDAPYWGQWWKIPLIVKSIEGTIRFEDYWTLINEHRVFFLNLLTIPLARITHWNMAYELLLTLLFGFGAFVVLCRTILAAENPEQRRRIWPIIPVISLLMFSYSQHNIWMWGLHVMIPMTLFAMLISIQCLIQPQPSVLHITGAIISAIIASYSFGAGIVIWGVGGSILILNTLQKNKTAYIQLAVWAVAWIATMAIYFIGYESTPSETTAVQTLQHPTAFLTYVAAYIGAPIISFHSPSAVLAGISGLACVAYLLSNTHWKSARDSTPVRMALSLILLTVGCALLTAMKQWPEGPGQAISSRYLMWPTMFWVGLLILSATGMSSKQVMKFLVVGVVFFAVAGTLHGAYRADERHDAFELGKEALRKNNSDQHLLYLYPILDVPQQMLADLIQYELSIFRNASDDPSQGE